MNRGKKWIIAAVVLLALGLFICGAAYMILEFDFKKLSTGKYVTNTHDVKDDFQNISIVADTEQIVFIPSDNGRCSVICYEEVNEPHNIRVEGSTLIIDKVNNHKRRIGIMMEFPKITVYLPKEAYEALSVDSDTGNVDIPKDITFESIHVMLSTGSVSCRASATESVEIQTSTGQIDVSCLTAKEIRLEASTGEIQVTDVECAGDLSVSVSTGRNSLENVSCASLVSTGSTGDILMTNVITSEEFNIERSTGTVRFDACDAGTIYVRTDMGDISGTLLTDKVFITETDTGKTNVPKTITGEKCEIKTGAGDITIEIVYE
ncbi:MAG: DUF4097 family beta strand repeat-containing protein [Lachnospiraceae bacterium]|jgi:DUF4097 and DUF4098 domain-containing protein YvlB